MRNHRRFAKRQEHGNGRAHAFLRRIALPQRIDVRTGFLHRCFYQPHHLGTLLEGWGFDIVAQDRPLPTEALLDQAYGFLAGNFSGGMPTHAITDDIEPESLVNKTCILVVVTLTTHIRPSRGGNTHVCLTCSEVQGPWLYCAICILWLTDVALSSHPLPLFPSWQEGSSWIVANTRAT